MLIIAFGIVLVSELAIIHILPGFNLCASFFSLFEGSFKDSPFNSHISPFNYQRLFKPVQLRIEAEGDYPVQTLDLSHRAVGKSEKRCSYHPGILVKGRQVMSLFPTA